MRRIGMLVMAAATCFAPAPADAQQGAPSLAERLALFSKSDKDKDDAQPEIRQTAGRSRQSPRDKFMNGGNRGSGSGGRGLFQGLGRMFSRSSDDQGADAESPGSNSHPMPYDPSALSAGDASARRTRTLRDASQSTENASTVGPNSERARVQLGPQGSNRSRQSAANPPHSTQRRQRTARVADVADEPAPVVRRTPRKSPTTGTQRGQGELNEALADLQSQAASSRRAATEVAEDADAAPAYLDALDALAAPTADPVKRRQVARPTTPRRAAVTQGTTDFGHALAAGSAKAEASAKDKAASSIELPDPAGGAPQPVATASPGPQAKPRTARSSPTAARDDIGSLLSGSTRKPQTTPESEPQPIVESHQPTAKPEVAQAQPAPTAESAPEEVAGQDPMDDQGVSAGMQPIQIAPTPVLVTPAPRRDQPNVLFTSQQPVIASRVEGPQQLTVGQPATYRIVLENLGSVSASDVLAVVNVPETAELLEANATAGVIEQAEADDGAPQGLNWEMQELAAGETTSMDVRLTPRTGANLALGVRFTHAPVGDDAVVSVQEPKLAMSLQGPELVQFGVAQRYKLVLSNPGTGDAKDVQLELLPPGGDETAKIRHAVGLLTAGAVKELELELTAREAGALRMLATATATGGIVAEARKNVHCVKPELELDWRGPEEKFGGAVATYYLRVRNVGEAATDPVAVGVQLPPGAELVSASNGYAPGGEENSLAWHGAPLQPNEERFLQFKCKLNKPGVNQIGLRAETPTGLTDGETATTNVIAVADLKLDIADPKGPVAVGEPVVYEIRVRNRGAIAARGVSIVGLFSAGIDPTAVEGGRHTVRDGRVAFRTLDSLAAGDEVVLKIQANAHDEGTHVFRAEVLCQDLEMKLSAEEMTRFFIEDNPWDSAATAYGAEPATRR